MKILAQRKGLVRIDDKHILQIYANLEYIKGNQKPHFSLTADEIIGRNGRVVSGGCLHELILSLKPEYKIIADLHLHDDNGVPMHCVENGWYWLGKTKWEARRDDVLAEHLLIDITEAKLLEFANKQEFADYCETLKPSWKKLADEAIEFLGGYI